MDRFLVLFAAFPVLQHSHQVKKYENCWNYRNEASCDNIFAIDYM
jgi:hypothetical protein